MKDGVAAQQELEAAFTTYTSAKANAESAAASVSVANAAIETADTNLTYTAIVSPIDGVVISRDVSLGQTVAASLSAPTLFTIAEDLRAMEVHTSVAESDIGQLAPEMKVSFTVDAYPDRQISRHGVSDPQLGDDAAERGDLRRGGAGPERRAQAAPGHDGERDLHRRGQARRAAGAQLGAALHAQRPEDRRAGADQGDGRGRPRAPTRRGRRREAEAKPEETKVEAKPEEAKVEARPEETKAAPETKAGKPPRGDAKVAAKADAKVDAKAEVKADAPVTDTKVAGAETAGAEAAGEGKGKWRVVAAAATARARRARSARCGCCATVSPRR